MFEIFKRRKEIKIKDIVWKSEAARYNALLKKIKNLDKVVLLYSFENTKHELAELLGEENYAEQITSSGKICILKSSSIFNCISLHNRIPIFVEHYPSFKTEKEILDFLLHSLSVDVIDFYISLEDELLKHFGSENIIQLLEKIGIADDEAIEHAMISKSIQNAQMKIDEEVSSPINTRNSREWFEVNLKKY